MTGGEERSDGAAADRREAMANELVKALLADICRCCGGWLSRAGEGDGGCVCSPVDHCHGADDSEVVL